MFAPVAPRRRPLLLGPGATVTLHAAWFEQQTPARLAEAETVLETLGKLTQVGARAEQELARTREQARLDAVIESVGEAVWIETKDGPRLNGAARELLGLGEDETTADLDTELCELDDTPIAPDRRPRPLARDRHDRSLLAQTEAADAPSASSRAPPPPCTRAPMPSPSARS